MCGMWLRICSNYIADVHNCDDYTLSMEEPVKSLIACTHLMTHAISRPYRMLSSTTACGTYWTTILNHCVYALQLLEITMAR